MYLQAAVDLVHEDLKSTHNTPSLRVESSASPPVVEGGSANCEALQLTDIPTSTTANEGSATAAFQRLWSRLQDQGKLNG